VKIVKPLARRLVPLVLWLTAVAVVHGDATDDFVMAQMKRQNIPGLSLAIIKDGKVVKAAGYGVANRRTKAPATPETVYKIASVSKQFVATGIMLLVQDGRVGLDDRVAQHIPDVPPSWSAITLRHLLTHTSGLVREAPGFDPQSAQSDADVLKSAYAVPLRSAPGDKWQYSNVGYYALAEVITRVCGQPWSAFIADRVFKPAGMSSTHPTNAETVPNRATGYSDNDRRLEAADWRALRPSGAFLSTVTDLARWDAALYADAILTEASRRQMYTPVTLNDGTIYPYGFGWYVNSPGNRRQVFHGGGLPGFIAQFRRYLDDRLTVVLLMNLDDADDETIALGVAELHLSDRK
jgi:D-alanyl-D-alanine carboxypeptidase